MLLFFIIGAELIVLEYLPIIEVLRYQYSVSFPRSHIFHQLLLNKHSE
jgi:hypothetical protein